MALLGVVAYDPGTAVAKSTGSLLAMTAIDTTNCRIAFVAPSNGSVVVRVRTATMHGSGQSPMILLGIMEGSTVKGRVSPMSAHSGSDPQIFQVREAVFAITGLTPGTTYTWDAAYAVQVVVGGSEIVYGGPNNTTAGDAYGAIVFEVWEAANLLAGTFYDPATVASKATSASLAMTAFDTTNLRLTFTAPATGRVEVRIQAGAGWNIGGTTPSVQLGVLDGATVKGRVPANQGESQRGSGGDTGHVPLHASFPVTSLTPGVSYTWDAAYGVEQALASSVIQYGGPNNASGANAWGGFAYEIWSA